MDQARIYKYMEGTKKNKTKKKSTITDNPAGEFYLATTERGNLTDEQEKIVKEQNKLRKKVSSLVKKQKMQQAIGIIRGLDEWKPWGHEAQVKVCYLCICGRGSFLRFMLQCSYCTFQVGCRLMQLLIETAYIQPPVDQLGGGPPDIRPAFKHTFKTVTNDSQ